MIRSRRQSSAATTKNNIVVQQYNSGIKNGTAAISIADTRSSRQLKDSAFAVESFWNKTNHSSKEASVEFVYCLSLYIILFGLKSYIQSQQVFVVQVEVIDAI